MFFRVFVSLGLLALGYYVGREIGRGEPIRREMDTLRDEEQRRKVTAQLQSSRPSADEPKAEPLGVGSQHRGDGGSAGDSDSVSRSSH
jgi:hypothetical protein